MRWAEWSQPPPSSYSHQLTVFFFPGYRALNLAPGKKIGSPGRAIFLAPGQKIGSPGRAIFLVPGKKFGLMFFEISDFLGVV